MNTVLITGAARRGGAAIARRVHQRGLRVILHCRATSLDEARALAAELNGLRPDSAVVWPVELGGSIPVPPYLDSISALVLSASVYNPSEIEGHAEHLRADLDAHLFGHLALVELCRPALVAHQGAIVAITDIAIERASKQHLTYQIAKGALATAVRALAMDLAPQVRVNAVAPGALDWPHSREIAGERQQAILRTTPLARIGNFDELARAVDFLLFDATFTTGSTLNVDGGRSAFLE